MRSEAARELKLSIGALAAIAVLTALVAINLVQRMTPALAEVLEENVDSMEAAGDMLLSLAGAHLPEAEAAAAHERFLKGLENAARNRTEPEEAALVDELREVQAAAFAGEPLALQRALRALDELGHVNRAAAARANTEAKRLGTAGAWAIALLGMFAFGASLLVTRRLFRRVLAPLTEIERVLLAFERGDRFQRCSARSFPGHYQQLLNSLNGLFDAHSRPPEENPSPQPPAQLVAWLLDAWNAPVALVDTGGHLLATSAQTLELLASERGASLRGALSQAGKGAVQDGITLLRRSETWAFVAVAPQTDGTCPSG